MRLPRSSAWLAQDRLEAVPVAVGERQPLGEVAIDGAVFLADLGIPHGSEQGGRRPVVIIQNDDGCVYSLTVTMVPMTTAIKKPFQKSHYILRYSDCIRYRSMVEAEQIQTIDKDRIIRRIGHLDPRDISGIEEAMRNHFGFDIPDCIEAP